MNVNIVIQSRQIEFMAGFYDIGGMWHEDPQVVRTHGCQFRVDNILLLSERMEPIPHTLVVLDLGDGTTRELWITTPLAELEDAMLISFQGIYGDWAKTVKYEIGRAKAHLERAASEMIVNGE